MKILVSRTDRLGDVLLATPVLKKIKEHSPNAEVTFLVQKRWHEILQLPGVTLLEYVPGDKTLWEKIKSNRFDQAVVLRDEKEVTRAIRKAKVPIRIGPYSTLRSFFAFNRGLLQKRSQCKMHEAEYNIQLLERLLDPIRSQPAQNAELLPRSWVGYSSDTVQKVSSWLRERGISESKLICFHPGSMGSARYLRIETMAKLAQKLKSEGRQLVLTGSEAERELLVQLSKSAQISEEHLFIGKSLSELAELYKRSLGVIAHGTGPLHLAAAVDAPVFAIFPPIFVLSEKRWGPLTPKRFTWVPQVKCPAVYRCYGERCPVYDCMDLFLIDEAVQRILQWNSK